MAKKEASGFARANRFIRHNIFKKLRKMPEFRAAFNLDSEYLAMFKGRARYNKEYKRWSKQLPDLNSAMWHNGKLINFLDDTEFPIHNAWYTPGRGVNSSFYRNNQLSSISDTRRYYTSIPTKQKMPSVIAHETGHSLIDNASWDEALNLRNAIFKKYGNRLTDDQLQAVRDYNSRSVSSRLDVPDPTRQQLENYFIKNPDADEIVPDIIATLIPTPRTENISNALFKHYEKYFKTFIDPTTGKRKVYYDLKTAPKEARLQLLARILDRDNFRYADRKPITHRRSLEQRKYYDWVREIYPRGVWYDYSPAEMEAKRAAWLQTLLSGRQSIPPLNHTADDGFRGVSIPLERDDWKHLQSMFPSIFDIH